MTGKIFYKNIKNLQVSEIRILHITNNFPTPNFPIFGIFIKEQIESLRNQGIDNDVFFINSREEGKRAYVKSLVKLRRLLKRSKYDIIHCHHSYSGVIFLLSGHFPESRRLLSYQSNPRNEGGLVLFKILYSFFDRIILKDKPKDTKLSKVVYLPNGVNTSFFEPMDKDECKEKLGLDATKRYILFMDSYNRRPCKRIDRYSDTLALLKNRYKYDNIEPLVLTNTGRSLIPSYVNASDLHLLTSDFEGSPNSVKECLACNVPVVSTPVGNVGDMLSGIEGTYVSRTFDPQELAELSDRALRFSNFSSRKAISDKGLDIESVAVKLISVYHGMLSKERALKTSQLSPGRSDNRLISDQEHMRSVNRSLKVLLINNCHYRRGGADVVYLNTGDLLESRGHEVAYFSTKSKFNYETPYSEYFVSDVDALKLNFVEQLAYMPRKLYSRESSRNLKKVVEKFKPDIAHIHLYKGGLTASILPVLRKFDIPAVITLHDYSLLCPRNIMIDGSGKVCERCLTATRLNCIYHRCNRKNIYYSTINYFEFVLNNNILKPQNYFDKIISVSKFNYLKHSAHPLFRDRFIHLYNFYPLLSQSRPETKRGAYFLFYGRLSPEKGVATLINTWKRLGQEVQLKIVGGGSMSEQIKREIAENKLTNVEFLGFRKGDQLFELIRNASFVLVPSEWYENNPLTIVEAYSAGKPVIGSNIGGIPELIIEGKTGYLFDMGDSTGLEGKIMQASMLNDEQYLDMSEAAYRFACDKFSEKTHYRELLKIYDDVIINRLS